MRHIKQEIYKHGNLTDISRSLYWLSLEKKKMAQECNCGSFYDSYKSWVLTRHINNQKLMMEFYDALVFKLPVVY